MRDGSGYGDSGHDAGTGWLRMAIALHGVFREPRPVIYTAYSNKDSTDTTTMHKTFALMMQ
jgi:hypothetical protein